MSVVVVHCIPKCECQQIPESQNISGGQERVRSKIEVQFMLYQDY